MDPARKHAAFHGVVPKRSLNLQPHPFPDFLSPFSCPSPSLLFLSRGGRVRLPGIQGVVSGVRGRFRSSI